MLSLNMWLTPITVRKPGVKRNSPYTSSMENTRWISPQIPINNPVQTAPSEAGKPEGGAFWEESTPQTPPKGDLFPSRGHFLLIGQTAWSGWTVSTQFRMIQIENVLKRAFKLVRLISGQRNECVSELIRFSNCLIFIIILLLMNLFRKKGGKRQKEKKQLYSATVIYSSVHSGIVLPTTANDKKPSVY